MKGKFLAVFIVCMVGWATTALAFFDYVQEVKTLTETLQEQYKGKIAADIKANSKESLIRDFYGQEEDRLKTEVEAYYQQKRTEFIANQNVEPQKAKITEEVNKSIQELKDYIDEAFIEYEYY